MYCDLARFGPPIHLGSTVYRRAQPTIYTAHHVEIISELEYQQCKVLWYVDPVTGKTEPLKAFTHTSPIPREAGLFEKTAQWIQFCPGWIKEYEAHAGGLAEEMQWWGKILRLQKKRNPAYVFGTTNKNERKEIGGQKSSMDLITLIRHTVRHEVRATIESAY